MFSDRSIEGEVRPASIDKWKSVLSRSEQRMALQTSKNAQKVGYSYRTNLFNNALYWIDRIFTRIKR